MAKRRGNRGGSELPGGHTLDLVRHYAVAGAQASVEKLQAEIASIQRAFPEIVRRARTSLASASGGAVEKREGGARKRRTISAAGRARIAAAQRKRWALKKAESEAGAVVPNPKIEQTPNAGKQRKSRSRTRA